MPDPDILHGADQIARHVFGSDDPKACAKVYKLRLRTNLPFFKLTGRLSLRRSRLEAWIAAREAA